MARLLARMLPSALDQRALTEESVDEALRQSITPASLEHVVMYPAVILVHVQRLANSLARFGLLLLFKDNITQLHNYTSLLKTYTLKKYPPTNVSA